MDINMPKMDGITASIKIIEHSKQFNLPPPYIVALTAYDNEETIKECLASGIQKVIHKPINSDQIQTLVKYVF